MASQRKSVHWLTEKPDKLWSPGPVKGVTLFKAKFLGEKQPQHTHDSYNVGVVEKGAFRISLADRTFTASAGQMITLNPLEVHACQTLGRGSSLFRSTYVDPGFARRHFGADPDSGGLVTFNQPVCEDRGLTSHILDILHAIEGEAHESGQVTGALMEALGGVFKNLAAHNNKEVHGQERAVARSREYIKAKAHCDLTVDDLAAREGLSKYHFIRVFKATTGLSPHAYLVQRRLEITRRAIEQGLPLADAAAESGFSDQSHMTRWFKAVYCVTPGAYKRGFRMFRGTQAPDLG